MIDKAIYTLGLICGSLLIGDAQVRDTTQLPSEQVEVVKYFQSNLVDAEMIPIALPEIPEQEEVSKTNFTYAINPPRPLQVEIPEPEIRALAFTEDKEFDSNNGYLKMGYGNLNSPEVLGQYHYFIEDWFEAGVKGNYLTAKSKSNVLQKMADRGFGAYAAYYLNPRTKVKATFDGDWDQIHFYNFTPAEDEESKNYRRNINEYDFGLSIHHTPFQKSKLILNSDILVENLSMNDSLLILNHGVKENAYNLKNHWGKRFGSTGNGGLYIDSQYRGNSTRSKIVDGEIVRNGGAYNRYEIEPYIFLAASALNVKLGVHYDKVRSNNIDYEKDSYIWPLVDIKYNLKSIGLNINLLSDIDSYVNDNNTLTNKNRFWNTRFAFGNISGSERAYPITASKWFGLGLFGEALGLSYDFKVARIDHQNQIFFLRDHSIGEFEYQAHDMNETNLKLKLGYQYQFVGVQLGYEQRILDPQIDDAPELDDLYYTPKTLVDLSLTQTLLRDRLVLRQEVFYRGKQASTLDATLPAYTDINLLADLRITRMINVYGALNNVLNKEYFTMELLPNYGFNFHAGVKLIF